MNTGLNLADLRTEAKSLGINFEETWSPQRLQHEIEAKKTANAAPQRAAEPQKPAAESETPDPMGSLNQQGTLVNVGSTADPHYVRQE